MTTDRSFYEAVPGLLEALPESVRVEVQRAPGKDWREVLAVVKDAFRRWPFDHDEIRLAIAPTNPAGPTNEIRSIATAKLTITPAAAIAKNNRRTR